MSNKSIVAVPNKRLNFNIMYNLLAYIYIGGFVILGMIYGLSPIIYIAFVWMAIIFILPSPLLGLQLTVVMTMVFERWFTLQPIVTEYAIYKIYPLDIVLIITMIGLIAHQVLGKKHKLIFGLAEALLALFMVINLVHLIKSFYNINADIAVAFSTFKNYVFYAFIYFITIYTIATKKQFKNTIHLILLTGIGLIGFIVIGLMRGEGLWTEFTPLSTYGVRFLAGTHAYYLMITSLIAISLLAYDRFKNKSLSSFIIIVWMAGMAASLMRHLWLSFMVGLFTLIMFIPTIVRTNLIKIAIRNMLIIASIILMVVLVSSLMPFNKSSETFNNLYQAISERTTSLNTSDSSVNWRINFWQTAKTSWIENPIFGLGFGQRIHLEVEEWQTFEEIRNIHNSPLAITIQMGLVGIIVFGLFVATSIATSLKWARGNEDLKPYYLGLLACLAAILFASLFQPYFETNLTGIFFWLILGLLRTSQIIAKTE
jgi:O-antigen ligase